MCARVCCVCVKMCVCVCVLVETRGYYQVSLFTTLHLTRLSLNLGFTDWLDWLVSETQGTPLSLCLQCWGSGRDHSDVGAGLPFLVLSILYSPSHFPALSTSSLMDICPVTWNHGGWGWGFYDSESPLPHSMEGVVTISTLRQKQAVRTKCVLGYEVSQKAQGDIYRMHPQPMSHSSLFCFFHNYEYKTLP